AEEGIDPLDDLRLAVLDRGRGTGRHAQAERAVPPLAGREAELFRRGLVGQLGAHDRGPFGEDLRLAEAALAEDRTGDLGHRRRDRPQPASSAQPFRPAAAAAPAALATAAHDAALLSSARRSR